jgi:sulfate transport system ATP-binding protein
VDLAHGSEVLAFRPPPRAQHRGRPEDGSGVPARISRILSFGVTARVELDGLNGSSGQIFEVEMTREEVGRLGLNEGQAVRLVPRASASSSAASKRAPAAPNWEI